MRRDPTLQILWCVWNPSSMLVGLLSYISNSDETMDNKKISDRWHNPCPLPKIRLLYFGNKVEVACVFMQANFFLQV